MNTIENLKKLRDEIDGRAKTATLAHESAAYAEGYDHGYNALAEPLIAALDNAIRWCEGYRASDEAEAIDVFVQRFLRSFE